MAKYTGNCLKCGQKFNTYFSKQIYCSHECSNVRYRRDLVGLKFNRWIVLSHCGSSSKGQSLWKCRCDCGQESIIIGSSLISGNSKSCGCYRNEHPGAKTHGLSHLDIYHVWESMLRRCENPLNKFYGYYGGRGIIVCEHWHDVHNFIADMGIPEKGLTIDRINNDGNYEPTNCRWATRKQQSANRRNTKVLITISEI